MHIFAENRTQVHYYSPLSQIHIPITTTNIKENETIRFISKYERSSHLLGLEFEDGRRQQL